MLYRSLSNDGKKEKANNDKKEKTDRSGRYYGMLAQVLAWTPPTGEHNIGLKRVMREQLEDSIKHDLLEPEVPVKKTGKEFREQAIKQAMRDIEYYEKENRKEVERAASQNEWVRALKQSLGVE